MRQLIPVALSAAYVIGYAITTDDLEANPAMKFAEGADDTGVIVPLSRIMMSVSAAISLM